MSLLLLFRPLGGTAPPPPPPPVATPPSGVKRRPAPRIRLGDRSREDTADFLKAQLRAKHFDVDYEAQLRQLNAAELQRLAAQEKREAAMRSKAAELEAKAALEAERQAVEAYNAEILKLIFLANL